MSNMTRRELSFIGTNTIGITISEQILILTLNSKVQAFLEHVVVIDKQSIF
jgi:hypothetical protein